MKQMKLFGLLLLIFLVEGTIIPRLFNLADWGRLQAVPDFLLVTLLMVAFFADATSAVLYGILFGFLTDLVFTPVLGVYAFGMGFTVYLIYVLSKWLNTNAFVTTALSAVGVCLLQFQVYFIYLMIGVTDQQIGEFLQWRLPVTIGLNVCFAIVAYYPFRHFLSGMRDRGSE
ncbi:MAG: rod shape-determining protein MreD [Sporolactobacillus sp.]|jgi:rod shape-determining protein MreD|nr:rod shape-determining protein MreD [Sporolactobacillus sp.]